MGKTSAMNLFRRLEQLNGIGAALSRERDIERLLENILEAAKTLTGADGGTLYSVTEDHTALHFEIMRTDSLGIRQGGTTGQRIALPDLPLRHADGSPNDALVAAYSALHDRTVNIADAYAEKGFDFSGTRAFDQRTGYRSQSFLTVPMKNHDGALIGVLQLLNALDPETGQVVAFSEADQSLTESLASQAAIALSNRLLITQLERLFESFVKLINIAIDEKSPYTGGHCERVPALTMMLAEAADATTEGPLADFHMTERDTINYHIVATIKMLETLPWPRHLRNVPEYAGGHHERMDGKGYPRGLTRDQMSVQARMMGIADIFEALTAADRPYKSGMKLSQAVAIMERMKHGGHIDPDLFEVFLRERVYLRYAERFLDAEQMDAVDVAGFVTAAQAQSLLKI